MLAVQAVGCMEAGPTFMQSKNRFDARLWTAVDRAVDQPLKLANSLRRSAWMTAKSADPQAWALNTCPRENEPVCGQPVQREASLPERRGQENQTCCIASIRSPTSLVLATSLAPSHSSLRSQPSSSQPITYWTSAQAGGPLIDDAVAYRRALGNLQSRCPHLEGCDIDDVVLENPFVEHAEAITLCDALPYPDNRFDTSCRATFLNTSRTRMVGARITANR